MGIKEGIDVMQGLSIIIGIPERRDLGLAASRLHSQCWAEPLSGGASIYAEQHRREMSAGDSCPWRDNFANPPLIDVLQEGWTLSSLWDLGIPQITPHALGLHASLSPGTHWPLKLLFEPSCCKNSCKSALPVFPANDYGEVLSLCIPQCTPLSLLCLLPGLPLLPPSPVVCFSPKPCLCTSYFSWCGISSPSGRAVCSVSPQVNFMGVQNHLMDT